MRKIREADIERRVAGGHKVVERRPAPAPAPKVPEVSDVLAQKLEEFLSRNDATHKELVSKVTVALHGNLELARMVSDALRKKPVTGFTMTGPDGVQYDIDLRRET